MAENLHKKANPITNLVVDIRRDIIRFILTLDQLDIKKYLLDHTIIFGDNFQMDEACTDRNPTPGTSIF